MDNNLSIIKLRTWARKPASIVALTAGFLVIVNAAYFGLQTLPGMSERKAERSQLADMRQQLEQVSKLPDPIRVTDADIQAVLTEVPTVHYTSNVIVQLGKFAQQSGVKIASYKELGGGARASASTSTQSNNLEQDIENLENSTGYSIKGTESAAGSAATSGSQPLIVAEKYGIMAMGPLANVVNYFELLAANPTITNIEQWGLIPLAEGDLMDWEDDPDFNSDETYYGLTFTFSLYSVPTYEEEFGVGKKKDTSVEITMNELKQRYPGVIDFESILPSEEETQ